MKTGRLASVLLALMALLSLAGAGALRFAIAPSLLEISDKFDASGLYVGTLATPSTDPTKVGTMVQQAIDAVVSTRVESLSGHTAVVTARSEIYTAPRQSNDPLQVDQHTYALNRQNYAQASAPTDMVVEDQKGAITIGFPPGADHRALSVYDSATQEPQSLTFAGTVQVEGRSLQKFTIDATGPVRDPAMLTSMRAGLGQKVGTDGTWIPKFVLAALGTPAPLINAAPERIPVTYTQHTVAEMLVDAQFGTIADSRHTNTMVANLAASDQATPITLSVTSLRASDQLVTSTIAKLDAAQHKLALLDTWVPGAMTGLGLTLLVASTVLCLRNRNMHKRESHRQSSESGSVVKDDSSPRT